MSREPHFVPPRFRQSTPPINPPWTPGPSNSSCSTSAPANVTLGHAFEDNALPAALPPARDDYIVAISPVPPSPQTPTRRSGPRSTSSPTSSSTPVTPSRRAHRPPRRDPGHSTSIDLSHTFSLDLGPASHVNAELEPEQEPLMSPLAHSPNQRDHRLGTAISFATKKRSSIRNNLAKMRWTVVTCTLAISVMCYLSWKFVLRSENFGDESEKLLEDGMLNLISTRLGKSYNHTNEVQQVVIVENGEQVVGGELREELGSDGDLVTTEDGGQFVYRNAFGGTFVWSRGSSSLKATAQSDTPSLAEEWDFETQTISGVNLGGWLTLEPFITPAMFEPFLNSTTPSPAVDEYTLSENLLSRGGEAHLFEVLDHHYRTFITEKDFAEIAGAGLNWVRIPLPFWSVSKWHDEPFLERTSWKYFLKALEWSRKYGLRVNLDLHSVPGSQNGWNHSGKWGTINWLHSTMGYANAQRSLDYIETLAEFVSRPRVAEVVKMFSLLNEPMMNVIGSEPLRSFYAEAYRVVRAQTGYNSGPIIAIHDGFKGTRRWFDFPTGEQFRDFSTLDSDPSSLEGFQDHRTVAQKVKSTGGLDRVAIDSHRYLAFSEPDTRSVREQILKPCQKWATEYNKTFNGFGIPIAGEFSIAPNDCGRFLNNVNQGTRLEGTFLNEATGRPMFNASVEEGGCSFWEDYEHWSAELVHELRDLAYAQMDTFQNWFYWTWKTSPSLNSPLRFANPLWSYSLGLERGWIPRNPRRSAGFCYSFAERHGLMATMPRRRARKTRDVMEGWKVGRYTRPETRNISTQADVSVAKYPWPPKYFNLDPMSAPASFDVSNPKLEVATLPRYARSVKAPLLPESTTETYIPSTTTQLWYGPIGGCDYPETWNSLNSTGWGPVCLNT